MSKTISSLLVGIGLDFDKKSVRGVESSFDSVKSSALKLGAVVAGAFGVNQLTSGFASSNDQLGKFSETFGLVANDVSAFDRALQKSGGLPGAFMSQISGLERLRAATEVGDFGFIEAASKAGINTREIIEATSATEAYLALADQFKNATQKQRLNMAGAVGLDETSIRLLIKGTAGVSSLVAAEKNRRPVTQNMLSMSRDFNHEWQDMNTNIGRVADTISVKALPHINNLLNGMNDWIEANQSLIDSGVDGFIKKIADNIELVGAGVAILATPALLAGLGAVAGAMVKIARLTPIAAAGAGGFFVGNKISEAVPEDRMDDIGRGIAMVLADIGFEGANAALNAEQAAIRERNRPFLSQNDMPKVPEINMTNNVILDGNVIDRSVTRVLDASVNTMRDELASSVQ